MLNLLPTLIMAAVILYFTRRHDRNKKDITPKPCDMTVTIKSPPLPVMLELSVTEVRALKKVLQLGYFNFATETLTAEEKMNIDILRRSLDRYSFPKA